MVNSVLECKTFRTFHVEQFRSAGILDSVFEVNCILEQITGMPWHSIREISPEQRREINSMAQRRLSGEPLQYIFGEWEFYGMKCFVGKGVLIPRPETECLIDLVLQKFPKSEYSEKLNILDLCTGSGCVALALKKMFPDAEVIGIDCSPEALAYAEKNKNYHKLDVQFIQGDVLDAAFVENFTANYFNLFDLIVSNPPYLTSQEMRTLQTEVSHEPAMALYGGLDGLNFYRKITEIWKTALKFHGMLIYEIGEQQGAAVSEILTSQNFRNVQVTQDLAHHDRIVSGNKI
ncbi:MAG: peptide chain release factor N(5)-glutamine methyltransferase [Oscillospiraceae bacterium]|nr:peptide chain release factor N(5)-glutamine methyltransferase [Oscillospiraceae bacterium]